MSVPLRYPASRYTLPPLIDLSTKDERERLSPAAIAAFFNMMERWRVPDEDARLLLGGISNGPFYELKRGSARVLDVDRLTRISYLVGIFKALGILYSDRLADEWVRLPNTNTMFAGGTPLAFMIKGGLPALQAVRRLLDARRAG